MGDNSMPRSMFLELESIIQALTSELHILKAECETSKNHITVLLTENKELSEKILELAAIYQNELAKNTERPEGRELVDNLQEQIDCLKTEKESVVQLWQTSIKTIDTLEEELQLHRNRSEAFVLRTEIEKLKRSYEDRIKVMEQQLADSQKRQNETIQLYSSKLEGKCTEVERLLEEKAHALKKLNELESQLEQLKNRLYEIEKDKRNLENTVKEKDKEILNLQSKLVVSRSKICEAIEVAETALTEKDDALLREAKTKDELASVSKSISNVVKEALENADKEITTVRCEYQDKLAENNQILKNTQEELRKEKSELQKYILKCEILEKEVEINKKGNEQFTESSSSKIMTLEKNMEATFQKLLLSEKQNLQMSAERENIKRDLEQMANHFERDIKQREVEKRTMQYKVDSLQKELLENETKINELNANLQKAQSKLKMKELEIQKQRNQNARFLEKSTEKLGEVETDLYAQLQQQMALSNKWKAEAYRIQEKFEEKFKELKRENAVLRKKLAEAENKLRHYVDSFKAICTGFNKIADGS